MTTRSETSFRRERLILAVVDDDEQVRRSVARLLRSCGYRVHVFASAEAYLGQNCQEDCAILDIQLPGINGLELEERLRDQGSGIAVVFITARNDAATYAAVEKTHRHLLTKPFDEDGLLGAIASAVDRRP